MQTNKLQLLIFLRRRRNKLRVTLLQAGILRFGFLHRQDIFIFFKKLQTGLGTHPAFRHAFARRKSDQGIDLTV